MAESAFTVRQSLSTKRLSITLPRPSMLIWTPAAWSLRVNSSLVNCLPWLVLRSELLRRVASVLKMPGVPLAKAATLVSGVCQFTHDIDAIISGRISEKALDLRRVAS